MSKEVRRRLGHIVPRTDGLIDAKVTNKDLNTESVAELVRETRVVLEAQRLTVAFDALYQNFQELRKFQESISDQFDSKRAGATQLDAALSGLVHGTRCTQNFLAAANSFLSISKITVDSWEILYPGYANWWNERRKDHDAECFAYRFLYELRNYSQHYGLPISRLNVSGKRETPESELQFSLLLSIDRDELLDGSYDWGKIASAIRDQSKFIQIVPLAEQYFGRLKDLFDVALGRRREELWSCVQYFKAIEKVLELPDGVIPVVFKGESFDASKPPSEFDIITFDQLRWILGRVRTYRDLLADPA